MTHRQSQMVAWLYEVGDSKNEIRIQIDKDHAEYTFIKSKAKEVGTLHTSKGEHFASLFQLEEHIFKRFYPNFELKKDKIPRQTKSKIPELKPVNIKEDLLKFLDKKAHSKSDIKKKFKSLGQGLIDKTLKEMVKSNELVIVGIKKGSKYKSII